MSKIKKQHFVPQFYLANFKDFNGNIYAYDIVTGESFSTTTGNIAHQKYFYDYKQLDQFLGREQAIEKAFAATEAEMAIMFREIIACLNAQDISEFTYDNYKQLADHIITQQRRTLGSRLKGKSTCNRNGEAVKGQRCFR